MSSDHIFLLWAYGLMVAKNIYSHDVCVIIFMTIVSMR